MADRAVHIMRKSAGKEEKRLSTKKKRGSKNCSVTKWQRIRLIFTAEQKSIAFCDKNAARRRMIAMGKTQKGKEPS